MTPKSPPIPSPRTLLASLEVSVVKLQAYIRRWHVEMLYEKALRRRSVAEELLQTEINYIANLRLLVSTFVEPLQGSNLTSTLTSHSSRNISSSPILNANEVRTLFSSVQVLLPIQEMFLTKLQDKIDTWHYDQTLGEMLSTMTPFLRLYAEYIGNFSEATELYQKLISKRGDGHRRFKDFVEKAYEDPKVMAIGELDSFLVQPIQRLPRYKMFLEQLLKLTPESHADRQALQIALSKVSDAVSYVNEKKRMHDQELQVVSAYGKIDPPLDDLVQPGRALVLEGPLQWTKSLKETRTKAWFFLFTDLLVITKQPVDSGKKFKFISRFDLRTLNLSDPLYHAAKSDHTPSNSSSDKITDKKAQNSPQKQSQSDLKLTIPAREPCSYLEAKSNGQTYNLCWREEVDAVKFKSSIGSAAEKVLLARETNPTTSEGKASMFKSSIRNHHTTASGTIVLKQGRDSRSPEHRPMRSEPISASSSTSPTRASSTPIVKTTASAASSSPLPTSSASQTASPEPQQKALRRFAERKRELGMSKPNA